MNFEAWAKLDAAGRGLPLSDHGGDVAAVMGRLLDRSLWRERLAIAAERSLGPQDCERLCSLAHLHDLGKANRGFWARQFEGASRVGHTEVTAALFDLSDAPAAQNLRLMIENWGADRHFIAVMAHHGRPLAAYHRPEDFHPLPPRVLDQIENDRRQWRADDNYDPLAELKRLMDDAKLRFPVAFSEGEKLPSAPRFVALFGGLVTLADWLGSDPGLFPVDGPHHAKRHSLQVLNGERAVEGRGLAALETPPLNFKTAFGFPPIGVQGQSQRDDLGSVALIEAETGSGKTEAALWRWLGLRSSGRVDGLYFALPTRSAAVQLHRRVQLMLDRVFGNKTIEAVLAVPGYLRAGDAEGQALPHFKVIWGDTSTRDDRWAAENPKRYLSARVAVGTIDQILLSGLQVRHAHFRAASLARSLLVVDEVHASDAFMTELLQAVLANHVAVGGHALLMSATLGGEARAALLGQQPPTLEEAVATPYPALSGSFLPPSATDARGMDKSVRWQALPLIDEVGKIAERAVAAARDGASVLVVRNSVAGAIAVARAIENLAPEFAFRVGSVPTLHHGRFSPDDRRLLDQAVERSFGRERSAKGRVLVGTQTLEQSLDIDADYLLTDLAPIDVLLQRIGRLHRHPRSDRCRFVEARAEVLVPSERDLSRLLGRVRERHGLGPMLHGRGVYPDLLAIEATFRLIEALEVIVIPRDNRRLVEGALHSRILDGLANELGVQWINHAAQQSGGRYAERGLARHWRLDMSVPFECLYFPEDEVVRTRLGVDDRLIDLVPPPPGPFGRPVGRLRIPCWMAHGLTANPNPEIELVNEGFIVELDGNRLLYSRFGLEMITDH